MASCKPSGDSNLRANNNDNDGDMATRRRCFEECRFSTQDVFVQLYTAREAGVGTCTVDGHQRLRLTAGKTNTRKSATSPAFEEKLQHIMIPRLLASKSDGIRRVVAARTAIFL